MSDHSKEKTPQMPKVVHRGSGELHIPMEKLRLFFLNSLKMDYIHVQFGVPEAAPDGTLRVFYDYDSSVDPWEGQGGEFIRGTFKEWEGFKDAEREALEYGAFGPPVTNTDEQKEDEIPDFLNKEENLDKVFEDGENMDQVVHHAKGLIVKNEGMAEYASAIGAPELGKGCGKNSLSKPEEVSELTRAKNMVGDLTLFQSEMNAEIELLNSKDYTEDEAKERILAVTRLRRRQSHNNRDLERATLALYKLEAQLEEDQQRITTAQEVCNELTARDIKADLEKTRKRLNRVDEILDQHQEERIILHRKLNRLDPHPHA